VEGWLEQTRKGPKLPKPAEMGEQPDYTAADKRALETPREEAKSIPQLAKYLTKGLKTDKEKARALYTWMIENIAYDYDGLRKNKAVTRPDLVLESRKTTCGGYSFLFEAMSKNAGLPVYHIPGWSRTVEDIGDPRIIKLNNGLFWAPHGWNVIKLDDKWYFLDPTWGSKKIFEGGKLDTISKERDFGYFLVSAETIAYTHAALDGRWQLLKTPLSKKEQEVLPLLWPPYFQHGLKIGRAVQPVLTVREAVVLTLEAPTDVEVVAHVALASDRRNAKHTLVQVRNGTVEIRANFTTAGAYELGVDVRKKGEKQKFRRAITYVVHAKAGKSSDPLPTFFGEVADQKAYLHYPMRERLAAGKPQAFVLSAPKAERVVIAAGDLRVELQKHGDLFVGEATLPRGEILVAVQLPGARPEDTLPAVCRFFAE
jgi:hypothetical protein